MAQQSRATLNNARISPRKVKIVLDLIRGKDAAKAAAILKNTPKAASPLILKLLYSACANAENNFHMDADELYVSQCFANPGPTLKRIHARARGSATRILKRTCHITVVVQQKQIVSAAGEKDSNATAKK